jgi:hypothetical protein
LPTPVRNRTARAFAEVVEVEVMIAGLTLKAQHLVKAMHDGFVDVRYEYHSGCAKLQTLGA